MLLKVAAYQCYYSVTSYPPYRGMSYLNTQIAHTRLEIP